MEEKQVLPDMIQTDLKMDFKMTGYKNVMKNMEIQKKPANISMIKRDIQIRNK